MSKKAEDRPYKLTTMRLPWPLWEALTQQAWERRISLSQLVREVLGSYAKAEHEEERS